MSFEILFADDSKTIRMAVKLFLKDRRWTIIEAENGRQGLDLLASRSFDLILTDLNMPEMDGFEMIQEARKLVNAATTPIVVMTSRDADDDVERAFQLGATAFVNKPLQKNELIAVLARHLGGG